MPGPWDAIPDDQTATGRALQYPALANSIASVEGFGADPTNRPTRNNNPGNMEYGPLAKSHGATGSDGRFAVFPDAASGWAAMDDRLAQHAKQGHTLQQVIESWAPVAENPNQPDYISRVSKATGLKPGDKIGSGATADPWASIPADPWASIPNDPPDQGPMLPRVLAGAARGVGLPTSTAELSQKPPMQQELENIHQAIRSGDYSSAAIQAGKTLLKGALGPGATAYGQGMVDQLGKTRDALKEGRYSDALVHSAATLVPFLGPAADAPDYVRRTGDVAGGAAQFTSNLGSILFGARNVEPKFDPTFPQAESHFQNNVASPMLQAVQPKNAFKFEQDLRRAVPLIKEADPNVQLGQYGTKDFQRLSNANNSALDKQYGQLQTYFNQAEARGQLHDGGAITQAMLDAIPQKLRLENPGEYENLRQTAQQWNRPLRSSEMGDMLKTTNAQLDRFYKSLPDTASTSVAANAHTATLEAQAQAIRQSLYQGIDPAGNGANVTEIQRRIGSLLGFRGEMEGVQNKLMTTPQLTPVGKAANIVNQAIKIPFGSAKSLAEAGAARMARPQTITANINRALENSHRRLADVGVPSDVIGHPQAVQNVLFPPEQ